MPGTSRDPHARFRTRTLAGGLAALGALLVVAACAPDAQETPVFAPWYPAENEVLGKGTSDENSEELTVYWIVWRGGEAVTVKSSFEDGNKCYEAATIREQLPDFCPEPADTSPASATPGALGSPPT